MAVNHWCVNCLMTTHPFAMCPRCSPHQNTESVASLLEALWLALTKKLQYLLLPSCNVPQRCEETCPSLLPVRDHAQRERPTLQPAPNPRYLQTSLHEWAGTRFWRTLWDMLRKLDSVAWTEGSQGGIWSKGGNLPHLHFRKINLTVGRRANDLRKNLELGDLKAETLWQ